MKYTDQEKTSTPNKKDAIKNIANGPHENNKRRSYFDE